MVDQETLRALRDASRELLVEVDLIALYLVGSRARGDQHADSDIDVAVLPRAAVPDPLGLPAEVADRLEGALGRGPVDVVVLDVDRLGLPLLGSLLRDAVVVASADEPARIDFEVRSMALVLDLEVCTGPLRASSWPGPRLDCAEVVDPERLLARLDRAGTELQRLRSQASPGRDALRGDVTQLDAAKYRLVVALQACIDTAQHVVASEGLRRPTSFANTFSLLATRGC